ncbi:hypothetical protein D9613_004347 [Agrocybe pediades]|uniref:ABC transporter domain-containing protein n=1 Tax=Agrocybe pediades TaxID=84607 RepID=A0A8H4QIR0_9AGAR|nr:hypothetical protein D9613_004347 [Agrocybe pediades]
MAGKSTTMSIVAGLSSMTGGSITFEGGHSRPPRGVLGIVPQKNVLFPELTCMENLQVWKAVKWSENSPENEDLEQLLRECDLEEKIHAIAGSLSGGQKRKLQLAIGLLGESKIILVDECTSGVDPLSRRSLWRTLTNVRDTRTVVYTTHFLDEADLLADYVSILAPPGKVIASGTPVALKQQFGQGYSVQVIFPEPLHTKEGIPTPEDELLRTIRRILPATHFSRSSSTITCYRLKTTTNDDIRRVLAVLDVEQDSGRITSYDLLGTTMEDVFLELMKETSTGNQRKSSYSSFDTRVGDVDTPEKGTLDLPAGRPVHFFKQAMTIFHKRVMIFRRSWLPPLLALAVVVTACCVPLVFINGHQEACQPRLQDNPIGIPVYLPYSPLVLNLPQGQPLPNMYVSPPGALSTLGPGTQFLNTTDFPDNATFVNSISQDYHNLALGGVSVNGDTGESLIAWEASPPGLRGLTMLNMASNLLFNEALGLSRQREDTPTFIQANYATFTKIAASTLVYLKFTFFFGGVMAVFPAFAAIYVSRERCSSVQAMQFSNGMSSPAGLWLGHLMFDIIPSSILTTVVITVFGVASRQFNGLDYMWCILFLYGICSTLFAYCISLFTPSPLAAFAAVAGYQFITYALYITSYMAVFTYAPITAFDHFATIIHFFISIISPVASLIRAILVSVNLFSLDCDSTHVADELSVLSMKKFGGPILYLSLYSLLLFAILVLIGPGSRRGHLKMFKTRTSTEKGLPPSADDTASKDIVLPSDDFLRVVNVTKSFKGRKVTDDVSISVPKDAIFALLGPNGAGKTTTFNIIRGDVSPDTGDAFIQSHSIVLRPRLARSALGVCPQFTAIDSQLTVRQHLYIYGRLKGLNKGEELERSIHIVLEATSLTFYAERLAAQLSGGNQRKLALAIALLGNPSVLLIDEFSSGVDPKMKREMWETLRKVSVGKAIVITTHSMEEAAALATCVGILSKRVLAMGTIEALSARYANYEVHFSCRTREDIVKARSLMTRIPGSFMMEDVATRFEVPVTTTGAGFSLSKLFQTLSDHGDFTDYTVSKASLESIFLKVVRENQGHADSELIRGDVVEEDDQLSWKGSEQSPC